MIKFGWQIVILMFCLIVNCDEANAQYVRKQHQPSFFVPQGELEYKPKEVPIVQYRRGEVDTVSHKKREVPKVVSPQSLPNSEIVVDNFEAEALNENVDEVVSEEVPEYQQVYQDYLKDVDKVAKGRKMPENRKLKADLAKMDSEERIKVDKKFNATRDVVGDFENALNY